MPIIGAFLDGAALLRGDRAVTVIVIALVALPSRCFHALYPPALPPLNPLRLYVMNKILLQCDNLCKRYQEGTAQNRRVARCQLQYRRRRNDDRRRSAVRKSTLLHLLGGWIRLPSGDVILAAAG